jgi:hypothetical protein
MLGPSDDIAQILLSIDHDSSGKIGLNAAMSIYILSFRQPPEKDSYLF